VPVGDILKEDPELSPYTSEGILCPFEKVKSVLEREVRKADSKDIVLDGAPRNRDQVSLVMNILEGCLVTYILLHCEWITAFNRAISRPRSDSKPEIISRRLNEYMLNIDHIIQELKERHQTVVKISSEPPIEEVRVELLEKVISPVFV